MENRKLDNTEHRSTRSGTTKDRITHSYSGSTGTIDEVFGEWRVAVIIRSTMVRNEVSTQMRVGCPRKYVKCGGWYTMH